MNHLFYTSVTHNLADILMRKRKKLIFLFFFLADISELFDLFIASK